MVRLAAHLLTIVIPAQAGIPGYVSTPKRMARRGPSFWVPAFAGTTREVPFFGLPHRYRTE